VSGLAALAVKNGTLTTTDLGDHVLSGLAKGLEAAGRGGLAKKLSGAQGGKTTVRDLAGSFQVKDGFLVPRAPFRFRSDVGDVTLGGRLGLDGTLDLAGGVTVPKKLLAEVISGVPLPESLDVPLALGGSLGSPRVEVKAGDAVNALLRGQVQAAKKAVREEAEQAGKKAVDDLLRRFGGGKK
jgi:AsmA protein